MLNCKDITRLVSESFERRLSIGERLNLWMHVAMCGSCRFFRRLQLRMHRTIRSIVSQSDDDDRGSSVQLPESARERIKAAIQESLKNDRALPGDRNVDQT